MLSKKMDIKVATETDITLALIYTKLCSYSQRLPNLISEKHKHTLQNYILATFSFVHILAYNSICFYVSQVVFSL